MELVGRNIARKRLGPDAIRGAWPEERTYFLRLRLRQPVVSDHPQAKAQCDEQHAEADGVAADHPEQGQGAGAGVEDGQDAEGDGQHPRQSQRPLALDLLPQANRGDDLQDPSDMHEEDLQALEQRREDLRKRIDEQKEKARKMQADIASWKQEKTAHTKEAISSWRQRREVEKLEARAERAEDYAVDMVSVASYDFDEAEQALLDAVAARYEANQAAAGPV
jgi:hypothetical protein